MNQGRPKLVGGIRQHLDDLYKKNPQMDRIQYVRGHSHQTGSDVADEKAKAGSDLDRLTSTPHLDLQEFSTEEAR